MLNIVLFEPEIPPNTGNIIRCCANVGARLHLIEPLGFNMNDKLLLRAGLDYHEFTPVQRYRHWDDFCQTATPHPLRQFAITTHGKRSYADVVYQPHDWLIFGPESRGLPVTLREQFPMEQRLRLPMMAGQRSLNLANAVAICLYEAWRQSHFEGGL